MLRKQVIPKPSRDPAPLEGEIPIADVATVQVTSEQADHPIDHAFDRSRGPGGSRWVAGAPGEQSVTLLFDSPQTIRRIAVEVEELAVGRTQELALSVSSDGGRPIESSSGRSSTSAHRARASSASSGRSPSDAVTHLRLDIKPDKGGRVGLASLTSLSVA